MLHELNSKCMLHKLTFKCILHELDFKCIFFTRADFQSRDIFDLALLKTEINKGYWICMWEMLHGYLLENTLTYFLVGFQLNDCNSNVSKLSDDPHYIDNISDGVSATLRGN